MTPAYRAALFLPAALLCACATPGSVTAVSQNHNSRISIVVIHHTTEDYAESLRILAGETDAAVSSHYLIPEPGDASFRDHKLRVVQLVPESRRAWHAGNSYWSQKTGLNDQSIGIELVNRAYCHRHTDSDALKPASQNKICFYPDYADAQLALLVDLLADIVQRYPDIKVTHIIGHSDIAPQRKTDPGPRFPWQRLYALGFGAWYDDATVVNYWERFRDQPLPLLTLQKALSTYGYQIEASGANDQQSQAAFRAFQMHFRPSQVSGYAKAETAAVLFALIEKYYPDKIEELLPAQGTILGSDQHSASAPATSNE